MFIVYCYTNTVNGKKYIGITSRTIDERERQHIYDAIERPNKKYNSAFHNAIKKYGFDVFEREILDIVETREKACELEIHYIEKYKTYVHYQNSMGYNCTLGGDFLAHPKDRVIQINADTLEVIKAWDSLYEAERNIGRGIHTTINNCAKIFKNSIWIYEQNFDTDRYKENILFERNYICQTTLNGEVVKFWKDLRTIEKDSNFKTMNILKCCSGKIIQSQGFHWCYYKDFIKENYVENLIQTINNKSIVQLNNDGTVFKFWNSLKDILIDQNISIKEFLKYTHSNKSFNNYYWRFSENYNNNLEIFEDERIRPSKRVIQFNIDGVIIKVFDSIKDASIVLNIDSATIAKVCKNNKSSGGYLWRYLDEYNGKPIIYLSEMVDSINEICDDNNNVNIKIKKQTSRKRKRRIEKLDLSKNTICIYDSIMDAARDIGVTNSSLYEALRNDTKSGGFYWKILDEIPDDLDNIA